MQHTVVSNKCTVQDSQLVSSMQNVGGGGEEMGMGMGSSTNLP